jgi:hypothetical protein
MKEHLHQNFENCSPPQKVAFDIIKSNLFVVVAVVAVVVVSVPPHFEIL